jgi:hypothetical protein
MGAQWLDFDNFLKSFEHPFFIKFRDPPKPPKLQQALCKNTTFTTSGLSFWHRKSIENSCFFKTPSWTQIFLILHESMPKSSILGPLQNPMGCKMGPKIDQVAPNMPPKNSGRISGTHLLRRVAPKGSQKTSGALTFWVPGNDKRPRDPQSAQGANFE